MTVTPDQLAAILTGATTLPPTTPPAALPAPQPEVHRNDWPLCGDPNCGEKLDPLWHQAGLHPGCEWPPPQSTVTELRDLLINHDANSARSLQAAIGPSEIGVPCDRQLGMRLHSLPRRPDPRVPWAPIQGTATHTYIADVLRAHNEQLGRQRWIVEERVWPDNMISGSGDAYDADQATVVDWKLVGANSLKKYRKTVRPEYRIQAHLYGLGHERAGRPVRYVRLVYLARDHDYDKSFEWTEPYDPQIAENALERMYRVMNLLADLGVADTPALWGAVPAIPTPDCVWCPYFRPGKPADGTGCPGDEAAQDRYTTRFADGLIISAAKEHTPL